MSPEMMGLLLGLVVGFLDFVVLALMANKLVSKAKASGASDREMTNVTQFMRGIGLFSLIAFPIIGYFLGPYFFETSFTGAGG